MFEFWTYCQLVSGVWFMNSCRFYNIKIIIIKYFLLQCVWLTLEDIVKEQTVHGCIKNFDVEILI